MKLPLGFHITLPDTTRGWRRPLHYAWTIVRGVRFIISARWNQRCGASFDDAVASAAYVQNARVTRDGVLLGDYRTKKAVG